MSNIIIRQATEKDIPVVESILLDTINWLKEIEQSLWSSESVTWEALSKKHKICDFYIAYLDGKPSGCMAIIDYDPFFWPDVKKGESLFVHKVAVIKAARKSGVSDALINYFKEQGTLRGVSAVRLDVHAKRSRVRAFYERHGFILVKIKEFGGDRDTAFYVYQYPS
jgi:N-acetylglutamate synthase-like GNAT family acetyltransferase